MKLVILSDIHANLEALSSVLKDIKRRNLKNYKICILGDVVNYGLRPNETINLIRKLHVEEKLLVCIMGNHEMALFGNDTDKFSEQRGVEALNITRKIIENENIEFIKNTFKELPAELRINSKRYLFIHASLEDYYWKELNISKINHSDYDNFDFVFTGHSHKPFYYEYYTNSNDESHRFKKRIVFINPGSIGQPRNHNPRSQYLIFDTFTEEIVFCKVKYNIQNEQKVFDKFDLDLFYKRRLSNGI